MDLSWKAQFGQPSCLQQLTQSSFIFAVIHLHKNLVSSFVNAEKFPEGKLKHQDQKLEPNESKDCILIRALNSKETFYRGSAYHW